MRRLRYRLQSFSLHRKFVVFLFGILALCPPTYAFNDAPSAAGVGSASVAQREILEKLADGRDAQGPIAAWRNQFATMPSHSKRLAKDGIDLAATFQELATAIDDSHVDEVKSSQMGRISTAIDHVHAADLLLQERFLQAGEKIDQMPGPKIGQERLIQARAQAHQRLSALYALIENLQPALEEFKQTGQLSFASRAMFDLREALMRRALANVMDSSAVRALGANPIPQSRPLLAPPLPTMSPLVVSSYATSDQDVLPLPSDQTESIDAPFAPEILAKAQSLGYDYARIFDFVRSTIGTQWYFGAQKGATQTLSSGAGNDIDQASLLIALLRASGAPARFVHGVIEVPVDQLQTMIGVDNANDLDRALSRAGIPNAPVIKSGHVAAFRFEHTWVSARVPYANYRGTTVGLESASWIPLDTAIKPYLYRPLADALKNASIDRIALWHDYLLHVQSELPLDKLRRELQDYLNSLSGPDLDVLTAQRQLSATTLGLLPASLPFIVVAVTSESAILSPDQIQTLELRVYAGTEDSAANVLTALIPVRELINQRVTLSYIPASVDDQNLILGFGGLGAVPPYLIRLRPQLNIAGRVRVSGAGDMAMGVAHRIVLHLKNAAGEIDFEQTVISGSYTALVLDAQGDAATPQADDQSLPGDSEQLAAELMSNLGMRYSAAWSSAENGLAATLGVALLRPFPNLLLVNNEVVVQQAAGLAMALGWKGVSLDAAVRSVEPISDSGRVEDERDWFALASVQGSALEHLVFEQQWSANAVSADKGLALASAQNIPLLQLTAGSDTSGLTHPQGVIDLVQQWLDRGLSVEIPQRQITLDDWTGSVWRVEDPDTGANGYFISGNWAGGATTQDPADWEAQFIAEALSNPYASPPNNDPLQAFRVRKIAATDYQVGTAGQELQRPLEVFVTDRSGGPVVGAVVTFALLPGSGGQLLAADGTPLNASVKSDVHGIARTRLKLAQSTAQNPLIAQLSATDVYSTQVGLHNVYATVVAKDGSHTLDGAFTAYAKPDSGTRLAVAEEATFGVPGQFAGTMLVLVKDQFGNSVSNQSVNFSVGAVTANCPGAKQPLPAAVFGEIVGHLSCDAANQFLLGSCAASGPNASSLSNLQGANAGIYLGTESNADYAINISSSSIAPIIEHVQSSDFGSSDCALDSNTINGVIDYDQYTVRVNASGGNIEGAALGDVLGQARRYTTLYALRDYEIVQGSDSKFKLHFLPSIGPWQIADAQSLEINVDDGGSNEGIEKLGAGVFDVRYRAGSVPAVNDVSIITHNFAVALPTVDTSSGQVHLSTTQIDAVSDNASAGFYSVQAAITDVSPAALVLQPDGSIATAITTTLSVQPVEYKPDAVVMLLEDGQPIQTALAPVSQGAGIAGFPPSIHFDTHKNYAVQAILNIGTPFEIRTTIQALPIAQGLFYNVDSKIKISQYLDVPNQYVCDQGDILRFSITQDARVTLNFYKITATGDPSAVATTLIDGVAMTAGDQMFSVRPEDLADGTYQYELIGVANATNQSEQRTGSALVQFRQFNSLPIGHPLVHGVDLFDGHLTVAREDLSLGGRGPGLHFARTYASSNDTVGPLGYGWSMNYSSEVHTTPCGEVIVTGNEGQGMRFVATTDPASQRTVFKPTAGYHGTLTQTVDGGFDFYPPDGTHYHYGVHPGQHVWLDTIDDTNGNRVSLTYDAQMTNPYPAIVADSAGRSLVFHYDSAVIGAGAHEIRLASITAPGGLRLDFTYAADNYLSDAQRSGASSGTRHEHYEYRTDPQHPFDAQPLLSMQDAISGAIWRYTYDTMTMRILAAAGKTVSFPGNNVIEVLAPDGGQTSFIYAGAIGTGDTLMRSVTDGRNATTTYALNDYGAPVSVMDPAGTTTMAWHGVHIEPISRTDKNGTTTLFTYDDSGNKTSENITSIDGTIARAWTYYPPSTFARPGIQNRIQTYSDARNIGTTYAYDTRGNRTGISRGGVTTASVYGTNGDLTTSINGRGQVTQHHYDAFGYATDALDTVGSLGSNAYDALGRKVAEVDGNGAQTNYDYDSLDRVLAVRYPSTLLGQGSKSVTYNDALRTRNETDENGHVTVTAYDLMGRAVKILNAANETALMQYDANGNKTVATDFNGNITIYVYDATNRLIDTHAPEGRDSHLDYDPLGQVIRETIGTAVDQHVTEYLYKTPEYHRTSVRRKAENGWAETTSVYDGNGNVIKLTDPNAHVTTRLFDERDRLLEQDEPEGKITSFTYDADDNRVSETLNLAPARVHTWTFDARKREISHTDGTGGIWTNTYDAANEPIRRADPLQHAVAMVYDARHELIAQSGPEAGMVTSYAYDLSGNRVQETWANGEVITHAYDVLNRPTSSSDSLGTLQGKTYDANGNAVTETDANGNVTTHHYDGLNRRIQSDLPEHRTLNWSYNVHGEATMTTDANGHVTLNHYNVLGQHIGTDTELTTQAWSYDLVGNVLSQIDARGNTTTNQYDTLNRKLQETDPAPLNFIQHWTYDVAGSVLTQADRRGVVSQFTYDAESRVVQRQHNGVVLEQHQYDAAGNLHSLADANGNVTTYAYDNANRKTQEQRPLSATTITTYFPIGDVNTITDADGNITTSTYDQRRHLIAQTDGENELTTYRVDGNGNRISKTRPLAQSATSTPASNVSWLYSYDGANRLIDVDDPLGHATTFAYDKNGNRLSQTDAKGHITSFTYDALNRRTSKTWPATVDGTATQIDIPDGNGNLVQRIDPNGQTIKMAYDALNRETRRNYSAAIDNDIGEEDRVLDPNGNVIAITQISATYQSFTTTRHYDVFDRLADETDRYGNVLQFVYDMNGNRIQRIDTTGTTTTIPDALNRLTDLTPPALGTTHTDYTAAGRLHIVTTPSGLVSTTQYDRAGRILSLIHEQTGAVVASYTYRYDANGNRLAQDETNGGATQTTTYAYDEADRLVNATYPDLVTDYDLDPVGNRSSETQTDPATHAIVKQTTATFNARDQLIQLDDTSAAAIAYHYDANGNLATKAQGGQTTNYRSNAQDRLTTLSLQGAPPSEASLYDYDADGLRIAKTAAGTTTHFRYDQQALIQESNTLGNLIARYDYSADRQLSEVRNSSSRYFLHDALKSPIAQVKTDGTLAMRAQYDAWGLVRHESGTNPQAFGFTGYQRDRESGLYYARARYYDPATARFTSEDPMEGTPNTPPSLHRYLYAYANPTVFVDPSGRIEELAAGVDMMSSWNGWLRNLAGQQSDDALGHVVSGGVGIGRGLLGLTEGTLRAANVAANMYVVSNAPKITDPRYHDPFVENAEHELQGTAHALGQVMNYLDGGGANKMYEGAIDTTSRAIGGDNQALSDVGGALTGANAPSRMASITAEEAGNAARQLASDAAMQARQAVQQAKNAIQSGLQIVEDASGSGTSVMPISPVTPGYNLGRRMTLNPDNDFVGESSGDYGREGLEVGLLTLAQRTQWMDFSAPEDGSVFYSGAGNRPAALRFAKQENAVPIDLTLGGRLLESLNLYQQFGADADIAWMSASREYATHAQGSINLFVEGASPDRVFKRVEEPLLKKNTAITDWIYRDKELEELNKR